MILRSFLSRLSVLALAMFFAASLTHCNRHNSDLKNHVVVRVNDAGLSAEDFSELLAARLKVFNVLSAKDTGVISLAKNAIVQDFIVGVVTQEWAHKKQIFVRKEEIEKETQALRSHYPDDIAFRKALADEGLTYSVWQERLKHTLLERLVLAELRKDVKKPSLDDIKAYYQSNKVLFQQKEAVHLRQVVLDSEVAALRIKKEITSGKSIAGLAKKFSISPDGAQDGDIGWIEKGYLEIFDTSFKMGVGQKSNILKSPFGYHIFEVLGKRPARTLSVEDARPKIEQALLASAEQEIYSSWLENQILKARVFKDDDFLKQIQVQTRSIQ